jgi:hypothetical protein
MIVMSGTRMLGETSGAFHAPVVIASADPWWEEPGP